VTPAKIRPVGQTVGPLTEHSAEVNVHPRPNPGEEIVVIPTDVTNLNTTPGISYTKFGQCDMRKLRTVHEEMRVVDQIYVVKGLPKVLFASNLCHELMHAYLFLSMYPDMSPEVEEGFCNAVSVMYLNYRMAKVEQRISSGGSSLDSASHERLLHELDVCDFSVRKFYRNEHPDYGEGFRKAMKCIQRNGFQQTLRYLKETGLLAASMT